MTPRADISIPAALATATIVFAIQGRSMPRQIDIRANAVPGDETLDTVRKQNAWMAAATVAGVSLIARDPVIFIVGGVMVIGLDWLNRVNNWTSPLTNRLDRSGPIPSPVEMVSPDVSTLAYDVDSAVS